VLSWLKKKSWTPDVLPELTGQEGQLIVRLTNVPCLRDAITGSRKYARPDFGYDFLMAFYDAIGGAQQAHSRLLAGSTITTFVRLPQQSAIGVEMSGKPDDSVRVFESDIADALINAFESAGLRPD
jgi:hypothetical protein